MKRTRTLIIAIAVLVLLIVGTVVVTKVKEHVDKIQTIDEEIVTIDEADLSKFEWTVDEESLSFEKEDDKWVEPTDDTFPVDQDKISEFLEDFASVHASFIIDDVEDFGQYGLEEPEATITFTLTDSEVTFELGGYSTIDEKRYVSIGDGKVYLIDTDLLEHVSVDRDDFILNDEMPENETINEFKVSGDTTSDVTYEPDADYAFADTYDYFITEEDKKLAIGTEKAEEYIEAITDLSLTDYVTYNASTADLSEYGLDNPALTCEVTGDENSYTVYVGYVLDNDNTDSDGNPTKKVYVRYEDSEIIYSVDSDVYDTLVAGEYKDLRPTTSDNMVFSMSFTKFADDSETSDDSDEEAEDVKTTLVIYNYDGESYLVEVNGEVADIISAEEVDAFIESMNSKVSNFNEES